ncbi:MAG TPA: phosphoenolpyruvate--protein phosphotransferase [Ktedonobacteraceae bacterium]|nr:phosphoenolpyruvate--protein phosphotransferase [Ktedonobacteraceae bacterium]
MTVGLVIVSHSTQLAAGVAELAGQMVQGNVPIAAAGGGPDGVLGTATDKILAAIQSLGNANGVLVLLDLGSAILSTEMALEMLDEEQRERVRISFAPLVEGAVVAALEASLGHSLAQVQQAAENTASPTQLQQLKPLSQSEETPAPEAVTPQSAPPIAAKTAETSLVLTNPTGLHARPASLFVQTAAKFQSTIEVWKGGKQVSASTIMGVLSLDARNGDTITIRARGADAGDAIEALSELVHANFYEAPAEAGTSGTVSQAPVSPKFVREVATAPIVPHGSWKGVTTSAGAASGPAFLYISDSLTLSAVERRSIAEREVEAEQQKLREAMAAAAQELKTLAIDLQSSVGESQAAIFEAQALMLDDPELLESALHTIAEQHIDAASALAEAGEQQAAILAGLDNTLLAARAVDVRDAVSRALRHLRSSAARSQDLSTLTRPSILVARDLTPSDTAQLHPSTILGICTTLGGPTAHAAILARALGIPAIAGLDEAVLEIIHAGDELGLDADAGLLYHQPNEEVRAQLTQRVLERQRQQAALKAAAQQAQSSLVLQGRTTHIEANIGTEAEAEAARQWGAEGVGLLRTEFLFASASTLPDEQEQRQIYAKVFRAFYGNTAGPKWPIVVRTLDVGADKPMPALNPVLGTMEEENPALGLRGIRISLAHEFLLEQQLGAMLLAAADTKANLHIMFPMITTLEELNAARAVFDRVYDRLQNSQVNLPEHVAVGIMVEVPAAAVMASELAARADFFSIGSNDLLQYVLAGDRTNAALSSLYNPMQPAVLRLIGQVAEAGRRAGKPVAVCGEMAGDVRLAPILVGLGVDELSMTPTSIPQVRTALSRWTDEELTAIAGKVRQAKTVAEVEHAYFEIQSGHEKG